MSASPTSPLSAPAADRLSAALAAAGADPAAAAPIPGVAMPMHMGLDGAAAICGDVFAKAFHAGALAPYGFAAAAEGAARAAACGIAPALRMADAAAETLVFDAAPAGFRMALARDLQKPAHAAATVAALKSFHAAPALALTLSPAAAIAAVGAALAPRLGPIEDGKLPWKGDYPLSGVLDWTAEIDAALTASGVDLVPTRGENTASNLLIGEGDSVLLVDFDRAAMADPFRDWGALSLDLCRTEAEREALVEMICGRTDPAALARLKAHAVLDDFFWALWAAFSQTEPQMQGPELYKYSSNRLRRAAYHIEVFDLGALLPRL